MSKRWLAVLTLTVCTLPPAGSLSAAPPDPSPLDCAGPAGDAEPGTLEWYARDAANMLCAQERHLDQAMHPVPILTAPPSLPPADAYRDPTRHDGVRFRFDAVSIGELAAEIYRPCTPGTCVGIPDELAAAEPPYPVVVSLHGGASYKELHWWSSQPLAEAGYLVVAFDAEGRAPTAEEADAVLDWLFAPDNPYAGEADLDRIGIAGHSGGGVVASRLGQVDERLSAIVSWDRAQSGSMPDDLAIRTPALFLVADYNCQEVPICQPEPHASAPDPHGPGNKGDDFERLRAAGVDTMHIALRAALHLDFVPSELSGNRWAELVTVYYTLAWFDRYLKGAEDLGAAAAAFARLTGTMFDESADRHNISQGLYDPAAAVTAGDLYAGNVPYRIEGTSVADRLSFYYRSRCHVTVPGSPAHAVTEDMRAEPCAEGEGG